MTILKQRCRRSQILQNQHQTAILLKKPSGVKVLMGGSWYVGNGLLQAASCKRVVIVALAYPASWVQPQ